MKETTILGIANNELIPIEIIIDKPNLLDKLLKRISRKYTVRKYTNLSQNIKITDILLDIPEMNFEGKSESEILSINIDFISKYTDKIVEIISILIEEKDKNFLKRNLSNNDMLKLVIEFFGMIDFEGFMSTIALTRNKTSLKQSQ